MYCRKSVSYTHLYKIMIKTVNLQKIFKKEEVETWALNNVNLEIKAGEFVAIMGPVSYTHLDVYKRQPLPAIIPQIYQSNRLCICIGYSTCLLPNIYVYTGFCTQNTCRYRNLFSSYSYHFLYFIKHINLANTQSCSN